MANREHLKILKQGVDTWNKWREENPGITPDFGGADLRQAALPRADLRRAYLRQANLYGANLAGAQAGEAILDGANLYRAEFSGANLRGADLSGAQLSGAELGAADLQGAELRWANLCGADLKNANFTNGRLAFTVFGDNDLTTVKGLETVNHLGPSTIGIDTIYKSKGNVPEIFLRGAGVPEDFITYMKSIVGNPIEFYSCFISYSSKDDDFAQRLHADLQQKGVRCWFAPEDLKIGDKFRMRIDESIRIHDKLLLVLSENSIPSGWVETEVEVAFRKERQENKTVLFPVRLDDTVLKTDKAWAAQIADTRHIGDFRAWKDHDQYQKSFERLLRDLKAESA